MRQYYDIDASSRTETELGILRQILLDVPRTHKEIPFFRLPCIQKSLERLLYVWSVRHPASGYVQGMNDLATPFMLVFFAPLAGGGGSADADADAHAPLLPDDALLDRFGADTLSAAEVLEREADCFWCFSRLLDGIQEHYIFAQPGIQRAVYRLNELVRRIDAPLCAHLEAQGLVFIQFAFRWMNNMLMREFPITLVVRLWDTYMAEDDDDGFSVFHVYVCAAFILTWAAKIKVRLPIQRPYCVCLLIFPTISFHRLP